MILGAIAACLAFLLGILPTCFAAQQSVPSASEPPSQSNTVLRSTTRLVQVSVIVQNKKGKPVTKLKKRDFAIFDEGHPQKIAFFAAESPALVRGPRTLPPNVFTNRFDIKGQEPGAITILLYDALNTSFLDQAYARAQILRFLKAVGPQDHVALYALTTQLRILQDFTEDTTSLVRAANQIEPKETAAFDASHPEPFDVPALHDDPMWMRFQAAVNNANGEISDQNTINRAEATSAAILAIAEHVAGIPGRKSLVWVSDGIPMQLGIDQIGSIDRLTASNDFTKAARALNRANLAIYPVDARGVESDTGAAAFFARQNRRDTFRLLADQTGGKAFYGTNDITGAMQSAFEDGRYTYTIGYYPDHGIWDGRFRRIKVRLDKPGMQLRYRAGYFALPSAPENEMRTEATLREAALSPLEATSLGLIVTGKALAPLSARNLLLQITLDPKQFLLQEDKTRRQGALDLLFLQLDASGKFVAADRQHFGMNFARKEYDFLSRAGLILQRRLVVGPNSAEIRVVILDSGSGALGSVTFPVQLFFPRDATAEDHTKPPH
jgi:VWFA-related protein